MSGRMENLTGRVFGRLTVLNHVPDRKDLAGKRFWNCRCTCGRLLVVRADNLKSGHSTKCKDCGFESRRKRKKVMWCDLGRE